MDLGRDSREHSRHNSFISNLLYQYCYILLYRRVKTEVQYRVSVSKHIFLVELTRMGYSRRRKWQICPQPLASQGLAGCYTPDGDIAA